MDDRELLDEFVKSRSQSAFRELVERHLPVVYSAARRMVRDSHLAEEVAQSVFTTLGQKAETIRPPQVLGGWLYNTTRYLAMHAIRTEQRRREREQTAFIMQSLNLPSDNPEILEHLEPAMEELDAEDRDALVLRYLANRGLRDVGAELGISEEAARKRVNRAVERLRTVLEKRSVSISTVLLATALTASTVAVPSGLGAVISTTALAPVTSITLTKATLITMKWLNAKTVAATIAAAVVLTGTGVYLVQHSKATDSPSAPGDVVPMKFANDAFAAWNNSQFLNEIDPETKRTPDSAPAGHIKSLVEPTSSGSADYLKSGLAASRGIHYDVAKNSSLLGKRIRLSGWIKTSDVRNWAGVALLVKNDKGQIFACDEMTDRPIHGTTDWQQIEIVADVPDEPCFIDFSPVLYGTGEIWTDDFQIDVVPSRTPITDDRIWHVWSPNPNDYSVETNYVTLHDGHPTLCITYTPDGSAPKGSWMWWGQDIRNPKKYSGHTVRMTAWIKTENISRVSQNLRPKGPNFKLIAQCTHSPVTGTTDWTQHSIICFIPKETQCLDTGFAFTGSGKVWIDMQSLKYEIADGAKN